MTAITFTTLPQRGVLGLGGADATEFLQDLISNDVDRLGPETSLYGLLLTPQGKFLHDFFLAQLPHAEDGADQVPGAPGGSKMVLDCEQDRIDDLERRLTLYRLRSEVTITDLSSKYRVAAAFGEGALAALGLTPEPGATIALGGGLAMTDPRLVELGARVLVPVGDLPGVLTDLGFEQGDTAAYDRLRLSHGVPDSSADMAVEKAFPLEAGLDHLNAIDFAKGCYVGQELTARTHYRGTIRKRLFRVDVDGPLPAPDTPVTLGDKKAGVVRSGQHGIAMAMLRLELVAESEQTGEAFDAGEARLRAVFQPWFGADEPRGSGATGDGAIKDGAP